MSILLLLTLSSGAAEPSVETDSTGLIVGTVVIAASEAEVRSVVDDAKQCGELSPQVVSVRTSSAANGCEELVTETKGLFRNLTYTSLRCPTDNGWDDSLVQSDDFSEF